MTTRAAKGKKEDRKNSVRRETVGISSLLGAMELVLSGYQGAKGVGGYDTTVHL